MLARLVQKELLSHLLDFRFVAVLALCALLSVLSVYVGTRTFLRQMEQHQAVTESNRSFIQQSLKIPERTAEDLFRWGILWNRRPEALSPVVFGLAGSVGQEVHLQHQRLFVFEDSPFAVDPVHALFEILDFAFIVKVILSLCVLLLTYDAICGEKEAGTLRLYASFAVPRSILALAKLIGSTVAVLVPFGFAILLASTVLALSPGVGLQGTDWGRMVSLMAVFGLYLTVFAAFGIWVSALTHRRMTAFLGLLGIWTVWVFVVPNVALRVSQSLLPLESFYGLEKQSDTLRWEAIRGSRDEIWDYRRRHSVQGWDALSESRRREVQDDERKIDEKWDASLYSRLKDLQAQRRNQMHRQQELAAVVCSVSPLGAVSLVSMDLARTGPVQQERMESALSGYLLHVSQFIQDKFYSRPSAAMDFSWFTYQDSEGLGECLSRNVFHILNLALLAVLGFAGAYVAILRYDVR